MGKQITLLKYFGGKNSNGMGKNILCEFPEKGTYDTYIEPFSGGFSIGLQTPTDMIAPIEIYNDLYSNVYSVFKVISDKDKFDQFKALCDVAYYSEEMRREFKEKLENENLDDIHRAFYYFYVNRTSHNGNGGLSKNIVVRRNMCKSVSDMLSTIDRLPELHQRLSHTLVLNRDGIRLMERYSSPNVFMYCDPPYLPEDNCKTRKISIYTKEYFDHITFHENICDYKNVMISLAQTKNSDEIYLKNGFTKETLSEIVRTINPNKIFNSVEIAYINYEIER
jgi:DNA adenine methylase